MRYALIRSTIFGGKQYASRVLIVFRNPLFNDNVSLGLFQCSVSSDVSHMPCNINTN